MKPLSELLQESAFLHRHLCPRQVLGIRMGLLAGEILGLDLPREDKRLLAILETDGCTLDGVAVATNCRVGRRTMRIDDYGKVAATFVDTENSFAIRVLPQPGVRDHARVYALEARNKWEAQVLGYQRMPADELLSVQVVQLKKPLEQIISRAGRKAICDRCGEEIINEREVSRFGAVLCRACAGDAYYDLVYLDVLSLQVTVQ